MRPVLVAAFVALPAVAAFGQPKLVVTPASCEEGRPLTLTLEVELEGEQHQALLLLEARAGRASKQLGYGQRRNALPLFPNLGPGLLTLELVASEDLSRSAVARLPRPDVRAGIEGAPFSLCRLAKPGETLRMRLSVVPRVDEPEASFSWKAFALPAVGGGVFVRDVSHTWRPGAKPAGPDLGGPPAVPGAESTDGVAVSVEVVRWKPWKGADASEVLIDEEQTKALRLIASSAKTKLQVTPAAFGAAAAAARAQVVPTDAVRLADDRWILQRAGEWWVVPPEGELAHGKGELFPLALDLARHGRAGFLWYDHETQAKLASALQEAGFGKSPGKALPIEVPADRLVEFLRLLEAHRCGLGRNGLAPLD